MEKLAFGDPRLIKEVRGRPSRLSFSQIEDYMLCPRCYFGRQRRELEKPGEEDIVHIGKFLAGVIASAHTKGKVGLKFENPRSFIAFARFKYLETLEGREKEETQKFLREATLKQMHTIEHILAAYYDDNRAARVVETEKEVKGQLGGILVWGRIDQVRAAIDKNGRKVSEIVEMKFNQKPNIWNSFQLGLYCYLEEAARTLDLPIRGVIYDLLGRRRFIRRNAGSLLIPFIVVNVAAAIDLGYDELGEAHIHFPQSRRRGGRKGVQGEFAEWAEMTRGEDFALGREHYLEAKELLDEYKKSCRWREENLREKSAQ
jgi:hypothetical protein